MKKLVIISLALAAMLSLTACNTFKGVGQDISAAGQGIDKAAASVQKKM
jgi:predicted small secreted protein